MFWLLTALWAPAQGAETSPLRWQLPEGAQLRYQVATDVVLPQFLWFVADFNQQARVRTFQVGWVMDCAVTWSSGQRSELTCRVEDSTWSGATFRSERGQLQPILDELDAKLTGAELVLELTEAGAVGRFRVTPNPISGRRNRRINQMSEMLRLVLARGIAGFDLHLPPEAGLSSWAQTQDLLYAVPSLAGTRGAVEVGHRVQPDGDVWVIRSAGEGALAPATTGLVENIYTGPTTSVARFDPQRGLLLDRRWQVTTVPTASSPVAQGLAGLPYAQRGSLTLLAPDEVVTLGPNQEWAPAADLPSTLLRGQDLQGDADGPR